MVLIKCLRRTYSMKLNVSLCEFLDECYKIIKAFETHYYNNCLRENLA